MFSTWYEFWRFVYLNRRTFADKIFRDKAFNVAKYPKYDGYQRGTAAMVYEIFDRKTSGSGKMIFFQWRISRRITQTNY